MKAAKAQKGKRTRRSTGEYTEQSQVTFREYAFAAVERYHGKSGGNSLREHTRADYRRSLQRWVFADVSEPGPFGSRIKLAHLTPQHVAAFVAWPMTQTGAHGKPLSDSTIRNILNPVRACFATAVREGLVRHNPTAGVALHTGRASRRTRRRSARSPASSWPWSCRSCTPRHRCAHVMEGEAAPPLSLTEELAV
jgi:hypothetical protein